MVQFFRPSETYFIAQVAAVVTVVFRLAHIPALLLWYRYTVLVSLHRFSYSSVDGADCPPLGVGGISVQPAGALRQSTLRWNSVLRPGTTGRFRFIISFETVARSAKCSPCTARVSKTPVQRLHGLPRFVPRVAQGPPAVVALSWFILGIGSRYVGVAASAGVAISPVGLVLCCC